VARRRSSLPARPARLGAVHGDRGLPPRDGRLPAAR
jgi:hypothetical protein